MKMRNVAVASGFMILMLAVACQSPDAPAERTVAADSPRRSGRPEPSSPELDLRGMIAPVQEYEGRGRNLFAYGAARREPAPVAPRPAPTVDNRPTTTIPRTAPVSPDARVNVKYAGFVEKTDVSGSKSKYAIFLDGNEIFAGAEGETVANRFTVVEIGLESVTVSAEGSGATQRIPLQAN